MKLLRLLLPTLILLAALAVPANAAPSAGRIDPAVWAALQSGPARVIVSFTPGAARRNDARAVQQAQDRLLRSLAPGAFVPSRRYARVPALAGRLSRDGLAALAADPAVAAVTLDQRGGGHAGENIRALGADVVHERYGLTGAGVTVAVLDSGIDVANPDFGGAIVAQKCFLLSGCGLNGPQESDSAQDEAGHGTNVAGIVASRGRVPESPAGFAPGAALVAVRVLDASNSGWVSDWVAGLDWIAANPQLGVGIVNMSLGTYQLYGDDCAPIAANGTSLDPAFRAALDTLVDQGVLLVASSGNQGDPQHMAAPACHHGVVAVGASYNGAFAAMPESGTYAGAFGWGWPACADTLVTRATVACFTNGSAGLDLVAPGAPVTASGIGGTLSAPVTSTYIGTSQAAPTVSGVAALLKQAAPGATAAQIEARLKASATPITDARTGQALPLVNALRALLSATRVTISGPKTARLGATVTLTATAVPTATEPLIYAWSAGEQPSIVSTGAVTATAAFAWATPGAKTVRVTVHNEAGDFSATWAIDVTAPPPSRRTIYVPLAR